MGDYGEVRGGKWRGHQSSRFFVVFSSLTFLMGVLDSGDCGLKELV